MLREHAGLRHLLQDPGGEASGDGGLLHQRQPVDFGHQRAGGVERARHAQHEVGDHLLVHRHLAVREQLDQHAAQQRIIRRIETSHGKRLEARGEVGQLNLPLNRVGLRGDQHMAAGLAGEVEQMEQGPLVQRLPRRAVDRHGARRKQLVRRFPPDVGGCDQPRAGGLAPDFEKVRLAAAAIAHQHHAMVRPVRIAVDHGDGRRVRRRDQKIVAPQRGAQRQVEHQLAAHAGRFSMALAGASTRAGGTGEPSVSSAPR